MCKHHIHAVLGEQHADVALANQPLDDGRQLIAFTRRHARGRLVHQQQAGLVGQGHGKLDPLDIAIRQRGAGGIGQIGQADRLKQLERWLTRHVGGAPPPLPQSTLVREQRQLHVFSDRHR